MANSKASTTTPDARRAALAKMTKARLISMCRTGITTPDGRRVVIEGGMCPLTAWSRDDLISSIMSAEFPAEEAPANLLLCDCGARLPWPTRTEDVTCPFCGNTWEHDGIDLGAGARLKVPASGPLSVRCPSCSAPRGGQCTGYGFCPSRERAAAEPSDDGDAPGAFEAGQQVHWTGLTGQFDKVVTIVRGYRAYLTIFGERPEDGRQVYDIHDPHIGSTVFAIPADQLHAAEDDDEFPPEVTR